MEVSELRIRLVNKFCEEVKNKQVFTKDTDTIKDAICVLDVIMHDYFNLTYNPETLKYE